MPLWNNCYELRPPGLWLLANQNYRELTVFFVYAVLHSFVIIVYELSSTQQKFCNPQACVKVIFGFVDIFPSTFLQPVNSSKNSILNWVLKIDLSCVLNHWKIFHSIPLFTFLITYFCSQESVRNAFSSNLET